MVANAELKIVQIGGSDLLLNYVNALRSPCIE